MQTFVALARWPTPSRSGVSKSVRPSAALRRVPDATLAPIARSAGSLRRERETVAGTGMSADVALDGERDVVAAKAEAVAERGRDAPLARDVRRVVQIALRIGRAVVDRGRDPPFAHDERGDQKLHRSRGAEHVTGARLGRAHAQSLR